MSGLNLFLHKVFRGREVFGAFEKSVPVFLCVRMKLKYAIRNAIVFTVSIRATFDS